MIVVFALVRGPGCRYVTLRPPFPEIFGIRSRRSRTRSIQGMSTSNGLGEFLRDRRESTAPENAGLPTFGVRRTPGLRREEVATLAGISADYYLRLERGRERNPSSQVLSALARVLRLDETAKEQLMRLAAADRTPRPVDASARDC